jgi:GTPase Era involved in 16S rRNA processing
LFIADRGRVTNLPDTISQLANVLSNCPFLPPELGVEAKTLGKRLVDGQLHLAVLGQFKRGKSTLINALLGTKLLPSGINPVTLVPVFLHFGTEPTLDVYYRNGTSERHSVEELGSFVTESKNPQNTKGVSQVDIHFPTALLESGVVLIDTPGVGSTLQHNTDATLDFLPRCDAGIVVVSADPPITAAEVAFFRKAQSIVTEFFVVLNKVDYLAEQDIGEALRFLRETLQTELGLHQPRIFPVSACRGLEARQKRDEREWNASGMAALEKTLVDFGMTSKQTALTEAIRKKIANLINRANQLLALELRAIQLPGEKLETTIATFQTYSSAAHQQRQELMDLLGGDIARLEEEIEVEISRLRKVAQEEVLQQAAAAGLPTRNEHLIDTFHQDVRSFFDHKQQMMRQQFRKTLNEVLLQRAHSAMEIRENLRREAANLLDVPHFPLRADEADVKLSEPAWTIEHLPLRVTPTFGDAWLRSSTREKRHSMQRQRLAQELTVRNTEKIRWWILRTIEESVRNFQQNMTTELNETIQQIERALQAGYKQQQGHLSIQQATISSLKATQIQLEQILHDVLQVIVTPS